MTEMKRQTDLHNLSAEDVLALCAFMTGGAIAFQDQRTMTPDQAMDLVMVNIQVGNASALNFAIGEPKGRA